ncbi:MAG: amphi-Trp domain-containing protein [Desulfonatronovibrionaceae bacterium]
MEGKNKIQNKSSMDLKEVITYLEELTKGFKQGKIVVQQGEEFLSLLPPESVQVEVEAKQKEDKEKFSLELSWVPVTSGSEESEIKITQKEPVVSPPEPENKAKDPEKKEGGGEEAKTGKEIPSAQKTSAESGQKSASATKTSAAKGAASKKSGA